MFWVAAYWSITRVSGGKVVEVDHRRRRGPRRGSAGEHDGDRDGHETQPVSQTHPLPAREGEGEGGGARRASVGGGRGGPQAVGPRRQRLAAHAPGDLHRVAARAQVGRDAPGGPVAACTACPCAPWPSTSPAACGRAGRARCARSGAPPPTRSAAASRRARGRTCRGA